jgi:hypothetical protein
VLGAFNFSNKKLNIYKTNFDVMGELKRKLNKKNILVTIIIVVIVILLLYLIGWYYDYYTKLNINIVNKSNQDVKVHLRIDGKYIGNFTLEPGSSVWVDTDYENDKKYWIGLHHFETFWGEQCYIETKSDIKFIIEDDLEISVKEI